MSPDKRPPLVVTALLLITAVLSTGCGERGTAAPRPDGGPLADALPGADTTPADPDGAPGPGPGDEGAPAKATLGSYVILTNLSASDPYYQAVKALQSHRQAKVLTFKGTDPSGLLTPLRQLKPEFVAIVAKPITIDVNFGYRILELATKLDDDPFVDFSLGYITGKDAQAALAFVKRIIAAEQAASSFPKTIVGFGPSTLDKTYQNTFPWVSGYGSKTIYHLEGDGFPDAKIKQLEGNGLMRFWGHGMPERIVKSLTAKQLQTIKIAPAVVFGGACYTGVVARSFDLTLGSSVVKSRIVPPDQSFCLSLISSGTTGYFGALDPDHGLTSVQEFEYMLINAAPLGRVAKHNYDTMVLAKLPAALAFPTFTAGQPRPYESSFDTMLNGAGARVLFGDPAYRPVRQQRYAGPYALKTAKRGDGFTLDVQLKEKLIYGSFVDIFRFGLGGGQYMNSKIYVAVPVDGPVKQLTVKDASCGGAALQHGHLSWAVERWGGQRTLHIQLDFPYGKLVQGCEVSFSATSGAR